MDIEKMEANKDVEKAYYLIAKEQWDKLVKLGKPAVEVLIYTLNNDRCEYIRREAARALGKIKDSRAVEPLIKALKDESRSVRRDAVEALDKIQVKFKQKFI